MAPPAPGSGCPQSPRHPDRSARPRGLALSKGRTQWGLPGPDVSLSERGSPFLERVGGAQSLEDFKKIIKKLGLDPTRKGCDGFLVWQRR